MTFNKHLLRKKTWDITFWATLINGLHIFIYIEAWITKTVVRVAVKRKLTITDTDLCVLSRFCSEPVHAQTEPPGRCADVLHNHHGGLFHSCTLITKLMPLFSHHSHARCTSCCDARDGTQSFQVLSRNSRNVNRSHVGTGETASDIFVVITDINYYSV
jgi:hypothetical protein